MGNWTPTASKQEIFCIILPLQDQPLLVQRKMQVPLYLEEECQILLHFHLLEVLLSHHLLLPKWNKKLCLKNMNSGGHSILLACLMVTCSHRILKHFWEDLSKLRKFLLNSLTGESRKLITMLEDFESS